MIGIAIALVNLGDDIIRFLWIENIKTFKSQKINNLGHFNFLTVITII